MASMHVSLSEAMKRWVEGQIDSGQYHNASEYVRDLIRRDQEGRERLSALRAHLAEGVNDIAAGRFDEFISKDKTAKSFAQVKDTPR
jgi:antitoxin ParD1/3/4